MVDLSEISFVKRIVVGSSNPTDLQSEERVEKSMALLNRCLSDAPKGKIIGVERSFAVLAVGDSQVVLQWTTYQVGFARKPAWIQGA